MRIAQVCPYDYSRPGGVKSHIDHLSHRLREKGHEVTILAPNINADKFSQKHVRLFGKSRSVNFWGGTQIDINIALDEDRKQLKNFLATDPFDIIHYHTIWNPLMALQVRRYSKAKNVATFHDTPADTFIGQKVAGGILMPAAAGILSNFLDGIISVSQSQSNYIKPLIKQPIEIIPNGIELDRFHENHEPLEKYQDGMFNVLFLGRLEPRKGIFNALEVFLSLKSKYPNFRLIIAGDGDDRPAAEQYVKDNNMKDVVFLGFIDEEIKANLFSSVQLYLAPALYGESFGIVLLEAMACGTPIAGFGNAGYLNVVQSPWDTYFPTPKDNLALINAIEKLYLDKEERQSMIQWGIAEAQKYSWKNITEAIENVYKTALTK